MFVKKIKIILFILLVYQNPLYSKSNSFDDFDSRNLSKYFSGLVAFENKDNSSALNFFKLFLLSRYSQVLLQLLLKTYLKWLANLMFV